MGFMFTRTSLGAHFPLCCQPGAKSEVLRTKFGLGLNQLELRSLVRLGGEMYCHPLVCGLAH